MKSKKAQYSIELIVIFILLLSIQIALFLFFSNERFIIDQFLDKNDADAIIQQVQNCVLTVEIIGSGSNCTVYLSEKVGGRDYSVSLYENSTSIQLFTKSIHVFGEYEGTLNQSYTNISIDAVIIQQNGEVAIQ